MDCDLAAVTGLCNEEAPKNQGPDFGVLVLDYAHHEGFESDDPQCDAPAFASLNDKLAYTKLRFEFEK